MDDRFRGVGETAREIAEHALAGHAEDFPPGTTVEDAARIIQGIMDSHEGQPMNDGGTLWYDPDTGMIVIQSTPGSTSTGTAYIPEYESDIIDKLL